MTFRYSEQDDDFDHFDTIGVTLQGLSLDNISSRESMKRMMNVLALKETCFVGELSLLSGLSIEKTEILLTHLSNVGRIKKIDSDIHESYGYVKTLNRLIIDDS